MGVVLIKLYQTAIIISVLFADIYFEWQSEGYAAIAVAIFASYALTVWPIKVYDICAKWLERRSLARFD
jgi:hypothetical protein